MPIQATQKKTVAELVEEAHEALGLLGLELDEDLLEYEQWDQTWPTTACGFGGIAGQGFTQATTTVVTSEKTKAVVVFHNDRLAYIIEEPTPRFLSDLSGKALAGKARLPRVGYDKAAETA